jgi:hypothetical protein
METKPTKTNKGQIEPEAVKIRFDWQGQRQISKTKCTSSYSERLGTLTPSQYEGEIERIYREHWDILRPGSFRTVLNTSTYPMTIQKKVEILIPVQVVKSFKSGRKPKNIGKAIEKAIKTLDQHSQPINYHTVNGLLALNGKETSRQYIHGVLKDLAYVKAFSVAKVPYYSKRVTA